MRKVQLVNGKKIPTSQMGFCSVHEHILPSNCPPDQRAMAVDVAVRQLQRAYDLGMRTIIDVTANVDAALLQEVARRSPVQIVAGPGCYIDMEGQYEHYSVYDYLAHYMDCVKGGLDGTGVFPGALKIATRGATLTRSEERALTAAGIAQRLSGLPLCVHSVCACDKQQRVLEEAGADLSHTYFCHIEANQGWEGRTFEEEVELLEGIMEKGSYLCFNNFNNWTHTPEECMANLISRFVQDGYTEKLLATMDYVWNFAPDGIHVLWEEICSDGKMRDYSYLITHVVPWLREKGIPESAIHAMHYENPARLFG